MVATVWLEGLTLHSQTIPQEIPLHGSRCLEVYQNQCCSLNLESTKPALVARFMKDQGTLRGTRDDFPND